MNRRFATLLSLAGILGSVPVLMSQAAPAALLADKEDEHKGEKKDLGTKEVAGFSIQVTQIAEVKAGAETIFILKIKAGAGKPKAIRAWVGIESAEGSAKSMAEDEEKEWHAHVEVPKPIVEKSQFWLEVETAAGKTKVAYDTKK